MYIRQPSALHTTNIETRRERCASFSSRKCNSGNLRQLLVAFCRWMIRISLSEAYSYCSFPCIGNGIAAGFATRKIWRNTIRPNFFIISYLLWMYKNIIHSNGWKFFLRLLERSIKYLTLPSLKKILKIFNFVGCWSIYLLTWSE